MSLPAEPVGGGAVGTAYPPPIAGSVPVPAFTSLGSTPVPTDHPARLTRRAARAQAAVNRDDDKVRQAALSVGVAVAVASGSVVFLGFLILIVIAMVSAVQMPSGGQFGPDGHIIVRPYSRWGWVNTGDIIWMVVILAVVSLVLTSLVGWFMARRAVKPLAEALRLQRHFVADASHELRTPLTALSSRVQILQRRLDSGKPIDDVVDSLRHDTANMTRVLDDMLLTVEGAQVVEGMKTSVVECLRQAVTSLEPLAQQAGVAVRLQASSDMAVAAPTTSVTRALVAVIDNAIQHSPSGSTVDIAAGPVDRMAVIRVRDHGSGIAGVDPARVFERFAHGSESGRKRSFGLGLALASEVAHRSGGDIRVESTSSQGTTFTLSFPLA